MRAARQPAPGSLGVIQTFCNSACFLRAEDSFTGERQATAWLREHDLLASGGTRVRVNIARLIHFRETLRNYLEDSAHPDKKTVTDLNIVTQQVRPIIEWTAIGQPVIVGHGRGAGDRLLAELIGHLVMVRADGSVRRLKPCRAADCRWVFYDRSPNSSGTWCTMAICGSRHKMKNFRARALDQSCGVGPDAT